MEKTKITQNTIEETTAEKRKNADKKARNFDFASMVALSIEGAKNRSAQVFEIPEQTEISEKLQSSISSSFSDVQSQDSSRRNSFAIEEQLSDNKKNVTNLDESEEDDVGPALPPNFTLQENFSQEDDGFEDELESQLTVSSLIPTVCEACIHSSTKPVTAIAFDQQGSKFAVGGYSYTVNLYEFLKMDSLMKPFREIDPCECHVINDIAYSNNGETLLIATGNCQLKLLDRQGKQWAETIRGDQYLIDLSNTKGHTTTVNACCWHPINKTEFLTCSNDGTLRIWDTNDFKTLTKCINTQKKVIKTKNANGKRAIPTTCCYSADGKLIAAGCNDGSIQIWKNSNLFVNTTYMNRNAHSGPITSLRFSPDSKKILSRSLDNTLKLFNLNEFKNPIKEVQNLDNMFLQTDCGYSPHAEFVYTATSKKFSEGEKGSLAFFDAETLELVYKIDYEKQGCIRVKWHPKINQILVGLTDGTCRIYYDPLSSVRGAKLCANQPIRRARESEVVREDLILSPLTLEMFQPRGEEGEEKEVTEWRIKKFLRMQSNSQRPQFRKPAEMPISGPSAGGRLAKSGGTLHSYVAQQLGKSRNKEFLETENVRDSILRHAEKAESDPIYVSNAYKRTQPKPVFQEKTCDPENDDENEKEPDYKVKKLN